MENYNKNIDYLQLLRGLLGDDYIVSNSVKDGASSSGEIYRIEIKHIDGAAPDRTHEVLAYRRHPMDVNKGTRANINKTAFQVLSLYVRSAFLVSTTAVVMNLLEKQDNSTSK